jgi:hypothetical protein
MSIGFFHLLDMLFGGALDELIRVADVVAIGLLVDGNGPTMTAVVFTSIADALELLIVPGGKQGMGHSDLLAWLEPHDRTGGCPY